MKVKVGDLKTHLSKYLRDLEKMDEPLEVCLRDKTIAYLVAAEPSGTALAETRQISSKLRQVGLHWDGAGDQLRSALIPSPQAAGDGRSDLASIPSLRESRDW